jgi:Cu-processing system permease protein
MSRLDWRAWPMYDLFPGASAVSLGVIMALAYTAVMLALAVLTFFPARFFLGETGCFAASIC